MSEQVHLTGSQLYAALVALCQEYGRTTEATYDLLRSAVESIDTDFEETE